MPKTAHRIASCASNFKRPTLCASKRSITKCRVLKLRLPERHLTVAVKRKKKDKIYSLRNRSRKNTNERKKLNTVGLATVLLAVAVGDVRTTLHWARSKDNISLLAF